MTTSNRQGRRAASGPAPRTRRRLALPGWSVTVLLVLSAALVMSTLAGAAAGAIAGWRWLDARGWLPFWAQIMAGGFAVGVALRMIFGLSTGRIWARTLWGSWRRRLRSLT